MSRILNKWGTFTVISNSVIRMWPSIGTDAICLFLYLQYRTNQETECAFPSYTTIQADTTMNRHRISKAIRSLEAAGLMERKKRFGQSTLYTLIPPKSLINLPAGQAERSEPSSSAESALLRNSPVVRQAHHSSADSAPSVVRQAHSNKTDLTKSKEQEGGAAEPRQPAPILASPSGTFESGSSREGGLNGKAQVEQPRSAEPPPPAPAGRSRPEERAPTPLFLAISGRCSGNARSYWAAHDALSKANPPFTAEEVHRFADARKAPPKARFLAEDIGEVRMAQPPPAGQPRLETAEDVRAEEARLRARMRGQAGADPKGERLRLAQAELDKYRGPDD